MADFKRLRTDVQDLIKFGAPDEEVDAYIESRGFTPKEFRLANENFGTFTSAVKRGGKNVGSLVADWIPIMGASALEKIAPDAWKPTIQQYKEKQLGEAAATQEEIAKKLPAEYETYKEIEGVGDALGYAKEALGESLASFLPGIVTGGVGSVLSRGAVAKAGQVAGEAARKGTIDAAKEAAARGVPGAAEEFVSGIAEQRAVAAGTEAAKRAMTRTELGRDVANTFIGSAAINIPDAYQSIYSETGQEAILPAITAGSFNALLDSFTPVSVLRAAKGKGITGEAIMGAWYKRAAAGLGKGALTEGVTEGLQEITNAAAEAFVAKHDDIFTPENLTRFIDSAIRGAIAGGGVQAATGVAFGKQAPPPAAPLPPMQPLQPPLGTPPAVVGEQPYYGAPPVTPLEVEGAPTEAGPGLQPIRDIAGVRPEGALPETREPIIDPETGKITGYREAYAPPGPPELEGEQGELPLIPQVGGTYPLFTETPTQPTPAEPPEAAPRRVEEAPKPINELVPEIVTSAKKDPTASKILKGNNTASANAVVQKIQSFMQTPDADPVLAIEQLYQADRDGTYPPGVKPLTDAQRELLETTYKQLTGNDIEGVLQQRRFATAQQAGLFEEGAPTPAAPAAPEKVTSPEEAWNYHRNDDHPQYSELNPQEQEAWKQYVAMNRGSASNFQNIVQTHIERSKPAPPTAVPAAPTARGPIGFREVPGITPGSQNLIGDQIRGKQAIQVAEWISQNGPEQFRELAGAIADRLKFFKNQGFQYAFKVLTREQGRAMLLRGAAGSHSYKPGQYTFKSTITLPPQTSTVETVLHELLHAVTTPAILFIEQGYAKNTDLGRLVQELEDVSQFALKTLIERVNNKTATPFEMDTFNGLNNALGNVDRNRANIKREIISWSMTNPDMQMFMESVPYKNKNLFSAIVEAFRKFLGLSPRADTALYEVMRLTREILNAKYSDMQQAANAAGNPLPVAAPKKLVPAVPGKESARREVEYLVSTNTPAFRKWFGKSKIVNPNGTPKIMYHGTRYDIKRFKYPITFVSPEVRVANKFAANDMWWAEGKPVDEGANVMPLYVRAENPFDYSNPQHVKRVAAKVREFAREGGFDPYRNPTIKRVIADISSGSWTAIEHPLVWDAIIDLGFDAAYLEEFGARNLAVFSRNQLKSAISSEFGPGEEIDLQTIARPGINLVGTAPPTQTTKLQPSPTTKQSVQNAMQNGINAYKGDWWTKWRVGWVDVGAGLSKRLRELPVFDKDGKLRADLLVRAASQTINLIKTGLQSGIPVLNADGTIVIMRDQNNMVRSQQLADALDDNPTVKASGLSGRGFVAEIARALRGEEIINVDARRRQEAALQLGAAAAQLRSAYNQFKQGNISKTTLESIRNKVKAIQKRYKPDLKLNREKQVTAANIAWAKANLAAVPEVQEVLDIWRNINNSLLDLWVNTGLMTAETREMFRRDYPNYVPLYAAREDLMTEEQEGYTGKAAGAKTVAEIERLEGSDKTRNLWENMDKHYAFMTAKAYNNYTRKQAVEQLMTFGIDGAKFTKPGDDRTNLRYRDYSNPEADANGIVHVIVDNPLDVAVFQVLPNQMGPILKGMSMTTQALRAGALINPMYWIRQLIRDPIHASVAGQLDTIVTPFHAMKEYIQILANNSEEARILSERGVIGQIDSTISLQDYLKQVGTEKIKPSMVSEWSKKIMRMHEAADAATRVAIFKREKEFALKQGMTEKDAVNYAVHKARESINFAVRGNSPTLNALRHMIPFFSAALTSLDTLYRTASGYGLNAEEKAQVQRIFVKRAAMMVALSTAYAMLMQDDEDYKKLPDNVKDDNWLLPSPIGSENTFVKIPIPFEVGFLFKTLPEGLVRYMSDTSTGKEVLASYRRGFMRSMPGEGVLIPQAFKPGLEAVFNYSLFTDRPIEGMSDQGLPVEARGPNASEVAKMMSRFGLSEIGLSPAKIDHLVRGYMAELGTFTTGVASTMMTEISGKEPPAKNIENQVFFRAFLTDPNTSKAATDFYDIMQNSQEAVNMMNRLKKEGKVEELQEFLSDEERKKLISVAPSLRSVQERMAKIRSRINQIKADYDRDPEERRDEINKLQTMYDTVARQGYKVLEAAGIER